VAGLRVSGGAALEEPDSVAIVLGGAKEAGIAAYLIEPVAEFN